MNQINLRAQEKNSIMSILISKKNFAAESLLICVFCLFLIAPLISRAGTPQNGKKGRTQTWVEDSFEDFADGTFDAAGQNIYVSRDGKIRTINRYDLNNDGWIDLFFPGTHDNYALIPATLASVSSDRQLEISKVAVEGSLQAAVSDLNKDGYPDIVFCPNSNGVQTPRRFVTIFWGGKDGWPEKRSNGTLPVHWIKELVLADMNHDGWDDIVTLNREIDRAGRKISVNNLRIYWGGETGFLLTRYLDVDVRDVISMFADDFDSDGADDVALLKSDNAIDILWASTSAPTSGKFETTKLLLPGEGANCIYAGDYNNDSKPDFIVGTDQETLFIVPGKTGRSWGKAIKMKSFNASHITMDDIDGDSYKDILISNYSQQSAAGGEMAGAGENSDMYIHILWGDSKGFDKSRSSKLEARYQKATAIGDYDGDGHPDVAVAVNQGETSFSTNSIIYFGKGDRTFEKDSQGVPTTGAFDVITVPGSNGEKDKALFCNSYGGTIDEKVPLYLYWNGPDGFSKDNVTMIPFRSGYEATCADFNADGNIDLMVLDAMHGGQTLEEDTLAGANIFWGTPDGIDFNGDRTILKEARCWASSTADLNKDGYLDIVLGQFVYKDQIPQAIIYYGSKDGYTLENRVSYNCDGRSNTATLADFNKDGWLDMAFASYWTHKIRIFYGSPEGFSEDRIKVLELSRAIDLETADLNADGWLDLIGCSYADAITRNCDTGVTIFWGSPDGFIQWNAQWLPGSSPLGPTVADFDNDGYLDLFDPSYHSELTREALPCYLYWGGPDGFHPRRRTILINNSSSEGLAADFDKDGLLDLAVSNHTVDGDHHTFSKVFYNDGKRFLNPRIKKLPTHGAHWTWGTDMGHIYNRSFEQFYESSVFHWEKSFKYGKVNFVAEIPEGTKLEISVRSASSEDELNNKKWKIVSDKTFTLNKEDRYLQYKANFVSDNGDRYPLLDSVKIVLGK